VAGSDEVKAELRRFEIVEWWYDGLNGKIIPWTTEHGNTSHDPSVQAFVLKADGAVLARAPNAEVYQASSFTKWIQGQADEFEKKYPATRVPFLRAEVVAEDGGTAVHCPALDEAREAGRPVLAYFGREEREGQDRGHRAEVKAARKLEKSALDSKKAAEAAAGWVLLRFDLGDEAQARFAAILGVEKAPGLVLFAPGAEQGEVLTSRPTGASLAYLLKKHAAAASD
jgi:hypothetical protein